MPSAIEKARESILTINPVLCRRELRHQLHYFPVLAVNKQLGVFLLWYFACEPVVVQYPQVFHAWSVKESRNMARLDDVD